MRVGWYNKKLLGRGILLKRQHQNTLRWLPSYWHKYWLFKRNRLIHNQHQQNPPSLSSLSSLSSIYIYIYTLLYHGHRGGKKFGSVQMRLKGGRFTWLGGGSRCKQRHPPPTEFYLPLHPGSQCRTPPLTPWQSQLHLMSPNLNLLWSGRLMRQICPRPKINIIYWAKINI